MHPVPQLLFNGIMKIQSYSHRISATFAYCVPDLLVDGNDLVFVFPWCKVDVFYLIAINGPGNFQEAQSTFDNCSVGDPQVVCPCSESLFILQFQNLILNDLFHPYLPHFRIFQQLSCYGQIKIILWCSS